MQESTLSPITRARTEQLGQAITLAELADMAKLLAGVLSRHDSQAP
jgi:hypothetical protein